MNSKRGLSDVVTTVLIILLAVAAVSALWIIVKPLIDKSGATLSNNELCLKNNVEIKACTRIIASSSRYAYNLAYIRTLEDPTVELTAIKADLVTGSDILKTNSSSIPKIGELGNI